MLKLSFSKTINTKSDALIVLFDSKTGSQYSKTFPKDLKSLVTDFERKNKKIEKSSFKSYFPSFDKKIVLVNSHAIDSSFEALSLSRKIASELDSDDFKNIQLISFLGDDKMMVDAVVSALSVKLWKFPKYSAKKKTNKVKTQSLSIYSENSDTKSLKKIAERANIEAESNSIIRELSMRAANDLNPGNYVKYLKAEAKKLGLKCEVYSQKKLKTMGAEAFIAVAKASAHEDAAIVKLSYSPSKKTSKKLCLVGKGITYDTGGTCLKPAQYMLGMNGDMGGSAVAFATIAALSKLKVNFNVSCYLAISDNDIGSNAFRPNEIVTALNGKTIETIHTDAEGRMVLADTLCIASKEKANLMMSFATLTGACIRAIGTTYSGVFSHNDDLGFKAISAGKDSGERVWPFPMDKDFSDCLKSDIADTKQCRPTGGVDHIEAAYFLSEFVEDKKNYIHMDLSAMENAGGLAHVPTENTGFGVRFNFKFLEENGFRL